MKNPKKKLLVLAVAVCLIAILSFTTLAWFTDTDEATNTFTIGSIEIVQHEKEHNENNELVDFAQDKVLMPIVNVDAPSSDPNYEEKIVTVENTGNNPAYVRTHIAVPSTLVGYLNIDVNTAGSWAFDTSTTVTIDGKPYTVYTYIYNEILAVGTTSHELLKGVYLYDFVDVKKNDKSACMEFCKWNDETKTYDFSGFVVQDGEGTAYPVNVYVATQAVQSEGFGSAQEALDAAFGDTTPWN